MGNENKNGPRQHQVPGARRAIDAPSAWLSDLAFTYPYGIFCCLPAGDRTNASNRREIPVGATRAVSAADGAHRSLEIHRTGFPQLPQLKTESVTCESGLASDGIQLDRPAPGNGDAVLAAGNAGDIAGFRGVAGSCNAVAAEVVDAAFRQSAVEVETAAAGLTRRVDRHAVVPDRLHVRDLSAALPFDLQSVEPHSELVQRIMPRRINP